VCAQDEDGYCQIIATEIGTEIGTILALDYMGTKCTDPVCNSAGAIAPECLDYINIT